MKLFELVPEDKLAELAPAMLIACLKANKLLASWAETGGKVTVDQWCNVQQTLAGVLNGTGHSMEELRDAIDENLDFIVFPNPKL
jgi:hypothetical protein